MFFIMGINQNEKRLEFDQTVTCNCCGKYGHIEVFMVCSYFMLFFIPIFKWGKRYYVRMNCCERMCEIDREQGRAIEKREITKIDINKLYFGNVRHCEECGFTTAEDYSYCPKCGEKMR